MLPRILVTILLPIFIAGVFWPATRNDFVNYDDPTYVVENPSIQRGPTPSALGWALTTGYAANWHPVTWVSHMIDFRLFKLNPHGHHATSVLLHALATTLAFWALLELTGHFWPSMAAALFFGLHPQRVESVAWISERKDVLCAVFWMLALWSYARWARANADGRGRGWLGALTLVAVALGLMSKPMFVTFPFALLLVDYWPLRRIKSGKAAEWRDLILEKLPFFALSMGACVFTYVAQQRAGAVHGSETFPLYVRVENALHSYVEYLVKFFRPSGLAVYYPHPGALAPAAALGYATVVGVISLIAWRQAKARPWIIAGWCWYLGTLFPTIGIVQVGTQAMADRYTYLPMLGICVSVVWSVREGLGAVKWGRIAGWVAMAAVTLGCVILTRRQIEVWRSSESLFRHTIAVTGPNPTAHVNLGIALDGEGRTDEAITELQRALELAPDAAAAHLNLGVILLSKGRFEDAARHLAEGARLDPKRAEPHFCFGESLVALGRADAAIDEFTEAIRLKPDYTDAYIKLGSACYQAKRFPEALAAFSERARLMPDSADAHNDLGSVLFVLGRLQEAKAEYERALGIQPELGSARRNLESLQRALGTGNVP